MLDFNSSNNLSERITAFIDEGLAKDRNAQTPRDYLGASRLGVACDRALQYEYLNAPVDTGREFSGKTLRIFEAGHIFEDLAIKWLRDAGFMLLTKTAAGGQFGFTAADGRLKGHIDGVITSAPAELSLTFPMLWECKSLNNKSWNDTVKKGVTISKPVYATQMAIYQAYMETDIPGISEHPALFTAINKDTAELYFELVPFNAELAQKASDRAVSILNACEAHELLPRAAADPCHFTCKFCAWQERCWGGQA
jgi:hypothetical protein